MAKYGFTPWARTILNNHYHLVGHLKIGENLGPMMQKIHGSVAKLVNDLLPVRHLRFWRTKGNKDYFDGCLRDVLQVKRTVPYTLLQAVRAGIARDWHDYPFTHLYVDLDQRIEWAVMNRCFLEAIPYARYDRRTARRGRLSDHA